MRSFLNVLVCFWGTSCWKVQVGYHSITYDCHKAIGLGEPTFHSYCVKEWNLFPCVLFTYGRERRRDHLYWRRDDEVEFQVFLQWAGCPDLPETWRVKMSPFCEQMVLGDCMLWNSADARESMSFNNSISSSIIQFIVSLILSHNCWFICLFIPRNHVLFRVLVYLHVPGTW